MRRQIRSSDDATPHRQIAMTQMTEPASSSGILRATPRTRLLLSVLLGLALTLLLLCLFVAIPFLEKALNTIPSSNLNAIKDILIGFACIAMLAGVGTIFSGRKILRSGQYPPADAWVWRDTIIRHGSSAIKFGWLHIAIGALICTIGLGSTFYVWHLIDQAIPYSRLGKHVVIIKRQTFTRP